LGTIFRVTFTVFYRRIWNIVGKYSILCCDKYQPALYNQMSSTGSARAPKSLVVLCVSRFRYIFSGMDTLVAFLFLEQL
jgi:hypothetical protein